jgi:queuine tRNA-ribosyltransferase
MFRIQYVDKSARTGILRTAHGDIRTPAFMPVGTVGTVKGMLPEAVKETGADIILGNTYHLMLRPTAERVAKFGGLHKFMNWNGPILTDSGGFQVMSLSKLRKINERAVTFQSHLDGTTYELTPERAIEIQHLLGSDISMVLDECTPYPATEEQAAESMRLSMRWAERSKAAFEKFPSPQGGEGGRRPGGGMEQEFSPSRSTKDIPSGMSKSSGLPPLGGGKRLLFGIVQGSVYPKLREESAEALKQIGFDGYAIGGLAVGEGQKVMFDVLDVTMPHMPADKPRYLMGVGKPDDIIGAVMRGVDMFDCVIPTRSGRNARGYIDEGEINIRNAKFADDAAPLMQNCPCPACKNYTRAYIHHLFRADEMLGAILLTWHNLTFYQQLMQGLREAIAAGKLDDFAASFLAKYKGAPDEED